MIPKPPCRLNHPIRKLERLPRDKRMTIALGYRCTGGVIVAADTLVTYPNGTSKEESKVTAFVGISGTYAIANASSDLNATKTMMNSLMSRLAQKAIPDVGALQQEVSEEMLTWYGKLPAEHNAELILAAKLAGGFPELYYCEPPSTFLPVNTNYIGAGAGAFVTDALAAALFGESVHSEVQVALRKVAYLLYRAKKDCASSCGKRTVCCIIGENAVGPIIVTSVDMEAGERNSSQLDILLQSTSVLYLGSTAENIEGNSEGIALMMRTQQKMRTFAFHDIHGQAISLFASAKSCGQP